MVLPALYRKAHPAPESDAGKNATVYRDGARIEYDAGAHKLKAVLPAGGTAELLADGGVSVTGNVTITGNVAVTGRIDATDDIESEKNVEDKNGTMQEMRGIYNQHSHPPAGVTPQMN